VRKLSAEDEAEPQPGEKRPRVESVQSMMAGTLDAIRQAEGLNKDCRDMLIAAVPWLFRRASAGREPHRLQASVETWIGETFQQVQDQLQKATEASRSEVIEAQAERVVLEARVTQAQEELTTVEQRAEASRTALDSALREADMSQQRVAQAQHECRRGAVARGAALKAKQRFDEILAKHLTPVKAAAETGEAESWQEIDRHLRELSPLLEGSDLDSDALTSLSNSLRQAPGERSLADVQSLQQFEVTLAQRAGEMASLAEVHSNAAEECANSEASAQKDLTAANEASKAAVQGAREAKAERKRALTAASAARAALAASEEKLVAARAAGGEQASALEAFKSLSRSCLDLLQGKAAPAEA